MSALLHTIISRLADGLPLVASIESSSGDVETYKQQAKAIIKRLDSRSPTKLSIESGTATINYMTEDGIVFLVVADRHYPRKLVFSYLTDLHNAFAEELTREHGQDWRQHVATAGRAYAFLKFDRQIQRLTREYADPTTKQNSSKLAEELSDIQNIMRRNIQEVLDRGERLENVSRISSKLVSDSKRFKWGAKKLNLMDAWKTYAPFVLAALILILVIWWRFF